MDESAPKDGETPAAGAAPALLLSAAILAGALLGWAAPAAGEWLGGQVDGTVLLLVGLLLFEVEFAALRRALSHRRFLALALGLNFLAVPAAGYGIAALLLPGEPLFFTGLVIYFMAPCTDWFLGFTRLAGGNVALGTVLLPVNMILQLLLYPFYLGLFAQGTVPLETAALGETLLRWFLLPAAAAVLLRQGLRRLLPPAAFARLLCRAGRAVPAVMALLVLQIFAANLAVLLGHVAVFAVMLLAVFLFFAVTWLIAETAARLAGLAYPERALLAMITAARNAPMMLGVTAIALPDQPLVHAAIVIGMLVEFPHLTALRQLLLRSARRRRPAVSIQSESGLR